MLTHYKINLRQRGYVLGIALTFLFACEPKSATNATHSHSNHAQAETTSENPEVAQLEKEVLAIHDEVMPKMDDLMRLKRKAKVQLAKDSVSSSQKQPLQTLIQELEAADEAMMHWMRNYDHDLQGKLPEEKLNYLQAEKVKITKVKQQMLQTLAKAEKTVEP